MKKLLAYLTTVLCALLVSTSLLAADQIHRVAIHLDENTPQRMNLVLNNARNVVAYYQDQGEEVEVKVVAYGPGLHAFRTDTSPVKTRITSFLESMPEVSFAACNNTLTRMKKKTPDLTLIEGVDVVPSGVIELIALQEQGWSYIRP